MDASRTPPAFSIREAVGFGWGVARRHVGFFLLMFIVMSVVDGVPGWIQVDTAKNYPGGILYAVEKEVPDP
jgi:hypothetical protein